MDEKAEKAVFVGFEEIMQGIQFGSYVAPGVAERLKKVASHMPKDLLEDLLHGIYHSLFNGMRARDLRKLCLLVLETTEKRLEEKRRSGELSTGGNPLSS